MEQISKDQVIPIRICILVKPVAPVKLLPVVGRSYYKAPPLTIYVPPASGSTLPRTISRIYPIMCFSRWVSNIQVFICIFVSMSNKDEIKSYLVAKLQKENVFWSFDKSSCQELDDWNLIKYVLIYLDLPEIDLLFKIFPKGKIKRVWLDEAVVQGSYLRNMNICIANLYFDIQHPVQYLKRMETYYLNRAS